MTHRIVGTVPLLNPFWFQNAFSKGAARARGNRFSKGIWVDSSQRQLFFGHQPLRTENFDYFCGLKTINYYSP